MKTQIFVLFFILFGSYYRTSTDSPKYIVRLNTSEGKRIMKQCSRGTPKKVKSFFYVQDSTLNIIKEEFDKIKEVKSSYNSYINDLDYYAYQVIGLVIKKDSFIYINAFPIRDKNPDDVKKYWRKDAVVICDGGHNYWGILFNIKKKTFSDLNRNGPGPIILE